MGNKLCCQVSLIFLSVLVELVMESKNLANSWSFDQLKVYKIEHVLRKLNYANFVMKIYTLTSLKSSPQLKTLKLGFFLN